MLARLQQFITLSLLTTAAAWAAVFFARGEPTLAIVGALLILLGYALFLALEFILLWFVNRADPTPSKRGWARSSQHLSCSAGGNRFALARCLTFYLRALAIHQTSAASFSSTVMSATAVCGTR
jgi:hypothetical protein